MTNTATISAETDGLWSDVAGLLTTPLLILDLAGHLLACNPAGEALISGSFALQMEEGRLVPRRQADLLTLKTALATLHASPTGSVVCSLPSRDGKPSLVMHMRMLGGTTPRVLALVKDVVLPKPHEAAIVAASFGLTRAETRVTALLSGGLDTAEIAHRLGLQLGTVRNHIKRAMSKTRVKSQVQLSLVVVRGMENV